mgnify:CR=1 FL=1
MMTVLAGIAGIAIAVGLAMRFYWAAVRGAAHDTWYHLHLAEYIRKNRTLPDRVDQFLVPGPYDYPPALHLLLALFPSRVVRQYNWMLAPVVELLHVFLVCWVAFWLTGDITRAAMAGGIYATFPTQIVQFTALTPRVLGTFLVSLIVVLTFYGVVSGVLLSFAVATILGAILLLTHKMSSQTVLFLFSFLSIVWLDSTYLALFGGMVALATVGSGGHYLTVLRGHVSIINFWRRQYSAGRPPGEFMRRFGNDVGDPEESKETLASVVTWVKRNEWTMFVADNAWTFVLPIVLLVVGLRGGPPMLEMLAVWGLFILGFAILTQYVPYFKLVGDGYKYFMWGAFPTAVVLAAVLPFDGGFFYEVGYIVILLGSTIYAFLRLYLRVSGLETNVRDVLTDGRDVLDFLEAEDGENVLTLPFGMSFKLLYATDLKVLFHQNPKIASESAFPVPIEPLRDIVSQFDIDYVLVDTKKLDLTKFETAGLTTVFEHAGYVVLGRDPE